MATSLILLQLFFLTTGTLLLLLTTAAPVDDMCRQTRDPQHCVSILMATDTRTPTAQLPDLEDVAIEAAMHSAGRCNGAARELAVFPKDPNLKPVYENCKNLYQAVLDALLSAPANLQQHNYAKLIETAGTMDRAVSGCAPAFASDAGITVANQDVSLEAQTIAIIARNLH